MIDYTLVAIVFYVGAISIFCSIILDARIPMVVAYIAGLTVIEVVLSPQPALYFLTTTFFFTSFSSSMQWSGFFCGLNENYWTPLV
jgi:hypothetical protein